MPLRAEYTLHQSDLGEFLSAPVWEEKNGTPLSVLSAFARLDIDPWTEAARLAALPRDAAAAALAVILRKLPGQHPETQDPAMIADRLVRLLPRGGSATTINGAPGGQSLRTRVIEQWMLVALMAVLFLWAMKGLWS